jgi:hypothetical protein
MPLPVASAPADFAGAAVRSIEAGEAPHVVIDDDDVTLSVTVRPGSLVTVRDRSERHGWVHGDQAPLRFEKTSDGVRIAREGGSVVMFFGSLERRLDVEVPPQASLDVRSAGTMTVTGLRGDADLHSDDGSISVNDHRGRLHVTTSNGRIELADVEAPSIESSSENGRITLDRVRSDQVGISTDNGRIDIRRSLLRDGKVQTDDGRVSLGLDPQSDVTVSAHTSSGKILADPPLSVIAGRDDDAPSTIQLGRGSGRLEVVSDDGSISIHTGGV